MAGTKEIKNRILSVQDTEKITSAMYLIASTKLKKARKALDQSTPFYHALRGEVARIFGQPAELDSRYCECADGEPVSGTWGYVVITADKGLAGAYNQNVVREAQRLMSGHEDAKAFVIGEYGRRYFLRHEVPLDHDFFYPMQDPTLGQARELASFLLSQYDQGKLGKIFVVYTDWESGMSARVVSHQLLPFRRGQFAEAGQAPAASQTFEFMPSPGRVLDSVVPSYLTGYLYCALINSFCCEQNARMMAMNQANQNAGELLEKLSFQYNGARKAAITQEITEVSAGAKKQRKKVLAP